MKKTYKQVYRVECAHDKSHVFEKVFVIEAGTEFQDTEVETYCPYCEKQVTVAVQGKIQPDATLLRKFEQQ